MDWDKLRIFYSVAEAGSLTHAGVSLNLSQSAVSRQISALETEVGSKLFIRHARGLVLTQEGDILFRTVRSVFSQLSSVKSRIAEAKDVLTGTLKVAATVGVGTMWLPNRLGKFMEAYPDIKLEFVLTDGDVDFNMREADCAIRFGSSKAVQTDLVKQHLFNVSLNIYATEYYFKRHGRPKSIEELDQHSLIAFGGHSVAPVDSVNWLLRLGAKPGVMRQPRIELANAYGILQCVRQGIGIATLADYIARDYSDLVQLFPDISHPVSELIMVYPKEMAGSQKIAVFLDFLRAESQDLKHVR